MVILNRVLEEYGSLNNECIQSFLESQNVRCSLNIKYPYFTYRVGMSTISPSELKELLEYYENTSDKE